MFGRYKDERYDCSYVSRFVSLNKKINFYYDWIGKNITTFTVDEVRSFVDKIVLWYEFRFPDHYFDLEDVDKVMLGELGKSCNKVEWCNLFSYDKFYYMLNSFEKSLLNKVKFPNMVDLYQGSRNHFHLNDNGIITDADDVWVIRKKPGDFMSCGIFFNGKSLKDVERINIEENLGLRIDNVKRIVSIINFKESVREGLLDTVMYKMISSGGKYYGPRRAYLFAKEFERDFTLPIRYGDGSLINEYVENGGNKDLMCYIKYFDGDEDVSMSALEILSNQNLIGNSTKVKRKVFK
jgi:hypothetical protein